MQKHCINAFKIRVFLLCYNRRIKSKYIIISFNINCIDIIAYTQISFRCSFINLFSISHSIMRASNLTSCILNEINCIHLPYFLDVTHRHWVIGYRLFGINLHTHFHGAKYLFRPLNTRPLGFLANVEYRLLSDTASYSTVTDGQKERVLLRESKNCKMQDITVFCSDSCSDPYRYVRPI